MKTDSLGDRMKMYEDAWRIKFPRRMPLIVRVDGKAFHSLLRKADKPFDTHFIDAMSVVVNHLMEEVQGVIFAYCQSDEISLLLHNYKTYSSQAWFDNNLQKIVSISASLATVAFNNFYSPTYGGISPVFDSRAFIIPEVDVNNYFAWRQQDAMRNSVQMFTRSLYSHRECIGKNTFQMKKMCLDKGKSWDNIAQHLQRGFCSVDKTGVIFDMPLLVKNPEYILNLLKSNPEEE